MYHMFTYVTKQMSRYDLDFGGLSFYLKKIKDRTQKGAVSMRKDDVCPSVHV